MKTQRTNIEIDTAKLRRAKRVTGLRSAKAVVDFALSRLAATHVALGALVRMAGKVEFAPRYSYKRQRG